MPPLCVLEFYSGIGGMHYALKDAGLGDGAAEVVGAFDINHVANEAYAHNFPAVPVHARLIESVPRARFAGELAADVWTMSPPCQPFTRTGKQQASADPRTKSFLALLDILSEIDKKPLYILMENVKGFEQSDTRERFVSVLATAGYAFQEYLVSPEQLGIPNSRLRYYLIATLGELPSPPTGTVLTEPPRSAGAEAAPAVACTAGGAELQGGCEQGAVVKRRRVAHDNGGGAGGGAACRPIREYLEALDDARKYELDAKTICRLTRVLDIVTPGSTRSMCFTKAYGTYAEGTGSVLQPVPMAKDGSHDRLFHEHEQWAGWGANCQCNVCWAKREDNDSGSSASAAAAALEDGGGIAADGGKGKGKHKPPVHGDDSCPLVAFRLRYFTAREIARLMGFPDDFTFPPSTTLKQQRRLLGNSLNVKVVACLMRHLFSGRSEP